MPRAPHVYISGVPNIQHSECQFTGKESGVGRVLALLTQVPSVTGIAGGVAIPEAGPGVELEGEAKLPLCLILS